jgi:hypothetical protein
MAVGCLIAGIVVESNSWYSVIYDNPPFTVFAAGIFAYGTLVGILFAVLGGIGWWMLSRPTPH